MKKVLCYAKMAALGAIAVTLAGLSICAVGWVLFSGLDILLDHTRQLGTADKIMSLCVVYGLIGFMSGIVYVVCSGCCLTNGEKTLRDLKTGLYKKKSSKKKVTKKKARK